jgi:tripartite-type tricarboxylate transporter receptor subunit TctC
MRCLRSLLIISAALLLMPLAALAQQYPTQPVRLLVGFPAGGSVDIFARAIADHLSKAWGTPVVVENRGGANGIIATSALMKSAADGYTLMMTISSHVTNGPLMPNLPYRPLEDFTPIALIARVPFMLVAHPSFPARDIAGLVREAKARPGTIDYASPGVGSSQHLAMELLCRMAGISLHHIPYRGGAPALNDVIAGVVPLSLLTTTQVLGQVQDGRVVAFGVSSAQRSKLASDVPTISESGVAGYEADVWYGVIGPRGIPPALVARIQAEIANGLRQASVQKYFIDNDAQIINAGPDEFAALMRAEHDKWSRLIRDANISINN